MSSNFPIIFLYRGNRDFIPYTLYQAKQTNPNTRIILLGDESNKHYKLISEHFYCDDFLNGTEQLKKVYRHKSQWDKISSMYVLRDGSFFWISWKKPAWKVQFS